MKILKLKEGKSFDMGKGKTINVLSPEIGSKYVTLNYSEFEPKQAFTQHIHKNSEDVIIILKGSGYIRVEGKDYEIKEGDVVYIPAGEMHGTIAGDEPMIAISCQAPPDMDLYTGVYNKK
ncbi:cupin domain-containing protein [Atribacter laminatus]|uniref:Dimethlysulfonioproprionate lyase DddW n=1 Tax=Atribacter laminatus TaxID=2847778 RepID=A0A7T1AKZ9_ATRLM|nr:cupin domain-containing protein [Atribacter laminatus]QPM67843.1 Dimethlysulfonioproprionate lyase DddW [Atribacter laminatus]